MSFFQTDTLNRSGLLFQIVYIFILLFVPNLLLKSWAYSFTEQTPSFFFYAVLILGFVLYGLWLILMTHALGRRMRDFNMSNGFALLFPIIHIFFGFYAWLIVLPLLFIPGKYTNNHY